MTTNVIQFPSAASAMTPSRSLHRSEIGMSETSSAVPESFDILPYKKGNPMTNIIHFPGQVSASAVPDTLSFLHGWPFLAVVESEDDEALPIRGIAHHDGPTIEINPLYVTRADLEDRPKVALWLCPTLMQICSALLAESLGASDSIGRFTSQRWRAFRSEVSRHATMDWREILASTRREGVDYMADHLTASLFMESGLDDRLGDRHAQDS